MVIETAVELSRPQSQDDNPTEAAFAYLQNAFASEWGVAVVTGLSGVDNTSLLQRFLRTAPCASTAHIATPTDSPHGFLEAILFQFGFEPFDSSVADLQNLVSVYLRHEQAQGRRTVIGIEAAQDCGPRVLEIIQQLGAIDDDGAPTALLALTGTADLNRVLDSAPMAALAAQVQGRFVVDGTVTRDELTPPEEHRDVAETGELEIIHDGRVLSNHVLGRGQVIIGRSEHNDLSLASRFVSRHHALLVNQPDGAYIVDLKSTNGTYVNSARIENQSLKHDDVISIGSYRLRYVNAERATPSPIVAEDHTNFTDTMVMQSLSGDPFEQ